MAYLFNMLGWGDATPEIQKQPQWDDFPDLVQLEIFKYLDRKSLTNLRQISASARRNIENLYGIHVIVPARTWAASSLVQYFYNNIDFPNSPQKHITDASIRHIILQMEGKKITTLEMTEMPPMFTPFDFLRFVKYPRRLEHVKLKYVDVQILHDIFSRCTNLRSFEYTTGLRRFLPAGALAMILIFASFAPVPIPVRSINLIRKVTSLPGVVEVPLTLNNLKELRLTIDNMNFRFHSDWGNVIYCLLALPELPTLSKFHFTFSPKVRLPWKTYFGILSCVGELLSKTPNLQVLEYYSKMRQNFIIIPEDATMVLCPLMDRFGSNHLKELSEAMKGGPAPFNSFAQLARQVMSTAGETMTSLRELELHCHENDFTNNLFAQLIRNMPNPTLNTVKIQKNNARLSILDIDDLDDDEIDNAMRDNIPDLFTLPDRIARNVRHEPQLNHRAMRLPAYQSITDLVLHHTFSPDFSVSLNKITRILPRLKTFDLRHILRVPNFNNNFLSYARVTVDLPDNAQAQEDTNTFVQLEKLHFQNVIISLRDENNTNASGRFLMLCKNLRELHYHNYNSWTWNSTDNIPISCTDVLRIVSSLRKLDKLKVPIYFCGGLNNNRLNDGLNFWNDEFPNFALNPLHETAKNALERIGELSGGIQFWRLLEQPGQYAVYSILLVNMDPAEE